MSRKKERRPQACHTRGHWWQGTIECGLKKYGTWGIILYGCECDQIGPNTNTNFRWHTTTIASFHSSLIIPLAPYFYTFRRMNHVVHRKCILWTTSNILRGTSLTHKQISIWCGFNTFGNWLRENPARYTQRFLFKAN